MIVNPGTLCRVRTTIDPALPWATPGSIVEVTSQISFTMCEAKLLFGDYRDEYARGHAEEHGALIFNVHELEELG